MRPDEAERARLDACERALMDASTEMRRRGVTIVCEAFHVHADVHGCGVENGPLIGCCAIGAAEVTKTKLALSEDIERLSIEWDSIEHGFDGVPFQRARLTQGGPVLFSWWALGRRLRSKLRPIRADRLRGVS